MYFDAYASKWTTTTEGREFRSTLCVISEIDPQVERQTLGRDVEAPTHAYKPGNKVN